MELKQIVYTYEGGDVSEPITWEELIDICRGNISYAERMLGRTDPYHPTTWVQDDYQEEEIQELHSVIILTGGKGNARPRNLLYGEWAKQFFTEDTFDFDRFECLFGEQYRNIGGYWKEKDTWSAFDYTNGMASYSEEFRTEEDAIKYAKGIPVIPIGYNEEM